MAVKASIIIRAKNEERWITPCLRAIFDQSFQCFEVVIVDNCSEDKTIEKARKFNVKIVKCDKYTPGKAINIGIGVSSGEFLVFLSAHCIPKNKYWLENLIKVLEQDTNNDYAGVYGRQEPLSFTDDFDKRDMVITFGLDKRVQVKDSFFHNANSAVRRSVVEKVTFNEKVSNIEDRIWAEEVIRRGYKIVYEPEASVYHYHGIHQNRNKERAVQTVRVLEEFSSENTIDIERLNLNIVAIVTVKGNPGIFCGNELVNYTFKRVTESSLINNAIVSTDNEYVKDIAIKQGLKVPFLRGSELSNPEIGVEEVLKYSLASLEEQGTYPDVIVYFSILHPFRPKYLIDDLIRVFLNRGYDSVMAGYPIYKSCWVEKNNDIIRIDEGFIPSDIKKPVHIGYAGLGCVTYPEFIRKGRLLGDKVGIFEVLDYFSTLEIKDPEESKLASRIFPEWWENEERKTALFTGKA